MKKIWDYKMRQKDGTWNGAPLRFQRGLTWIICLKIRSPQKLYSSLFILHFTFYITAAQTLQVATKTVEKTFKFEPLNEVQIMAERADIEVNTWERSEIKIVLELSTKHPDRAVATKDLAVMQHVIEKAGNTLFLRNFITLTKDTPKPQSNFKARYVLFVPAACGFDIQNSFGKTQLKGLTKTTVLRTEFCSVILNDLKGDIRFQANFGDLTATNLDGKISIVSDRTDLILRQLKGQCRIKAQYGSLDLAIDKTLVKMNLDTKHTELRGTSVAKK